MSQQNSEALSADGLAVAPVTVNVFNFDQASGIYTGSSLEFLPKGVGLPAHSTAVAPPDDVAGQVCVYKDGSWQQVPDHRGETVYSTATGEAVTVTQPGDYPAGTTPVKPETAFDRWGGAAWVTDKAAKQRAAVEAARAEKSARITEAADVTQAWQTQLMLGIISPDDKVKLTAWMTYLQAVQATDPYSAPAVSWPERPAQ